MLRLIAATFALLSMVCAPALAEGERVVVEPYIGLGLLNVPEDFSGACEADVNAGGACIRILQGETLVTVQLADATGKPVSGWIQIWDAEGVVRPGGSIASHDFCSPATFGIPPGALRMQVKLHEPVSSWGLCDEVRIATHGIVEATFR